MRNSSGRDAPSGSPLACRSSWTRYDTNWNISATFLRPCLYRVLHMNYAALIVPIFGSRRTLGYPRPDGLNDSSAALSDHRTLRDVFLPDGTNVNHILVKDGWCWWYR